MGRGQISLRPFRFGTKRRGGNRVAHGVGQMAAILPRLQAFEAARPKRAAGLWPDLVYAADEPGIGRPAELRAMAALHPHIAAALDLPDRFVGNHPAAIFGQ